MRDLQLNKAQRQENYMRNHMPELHKVVSKIEGRSWQEKLYKYTYELDSTPTCPICGSPRKFVGYWKGYSTYCSTACSNKANSHKVKQTKLERYGSPGYNNREQCQQTCLERYGTRHAMQAESVRAQFRKPMSEERKHKLSQIYWHNTAQRAEAIEAQRQQTCLEKYGVPNAMQNKEIIKRCIDSFINSQGASIGQCKKIKQASKESIRKKTRLKYEEFIDYDESGNWICRCPHENRSCCEEHTYITSPNMHRDRIRCGCELCTKLLPPAQGLQSTSIEMFVRNILDECGIEYITNNRGIIPPYELDIYIPSLKLAIECNGVYWHSTKNKSQYCHSKKYQLCKMCGIQLLTIWEDWVVSKPGIVRSLLRNKIGCCEHKVHARKCEIKEVDYKTASLFLEANHIQGKCKPSTNIGLFYKGELVSLMCFCQRSKLSGPSKIIRGEAELIRFCNILNTSVVGGASKLLKYYVEHYNPSQIISFSSNDISNGHLYEVLGFRADNESVSYWYISPDMERFHRSHFTKDSLIAKGLAPADKSTWTESQVMSTLPYLKIYDSGTTRWRLLL